MLLRTVAEAAPGVRVRFTTSHPKDMSDETLEVIAQVPNVLQTYPPACTKWKFSYLETDES